MSKKMDMAEMRRNHRLLLLKNPNYFGNLSEAGLLIDGFLEPVFELVADTHYEELTCVSFNPATNELWAVVQIKQETGYSGGPCTDGSKEYVRFYVDYDRDGTWVDEGVVNFDAHDLPFEEDLCYAVKLKIDPDKRSCCDDAPVLPVVRAILSWDDEPPPGQWDWLPVWGNRLEADVQVAPRWPIICLLMDNLFEGIDVKIDSAKYELLAEALPPEVKPVALPQATLVALKEGYGDQVEDARLGFKLVQALARQPSQLALADKTASLGPVLNVAEIVDFIQTSKFNTSYEEVECVGLDREWSILHAGVHVKRPGGYLGDLCHEGSLEYVAFYMDFGSGWEYMGTAGVRVHDIPQIPDDGLWYSVALPVSLTSHQQKWCETGKARVRAILSWNWPPTPGDSDYVAPWGDWEECYVEVKPLPQGVPQGQVVPVITSLGGMPISYIDGGGYATGENSVGLKANDSPFDGLIEILGEILGAPDSSAPGVLGTRYRTMVKRPSDSAFQPSLRKFDIDVTYTSGSIPGTPVTVTQTPSPPDGWVDYYPDPFLPDAVSVDRNLLAVIVSAEKGLHEVYVEMYDPNTGSHAYSNTVKFMVDKTPPRVDIEIKSGSGNCGGFAKGDVIYGDFYVWDDHCSSVALSVTPAPEAHGARPTIDGSGGLSGLEYGAGLPGAGISGTWTLDTAAMDPCGYNVRIHGVERTIINSRWVGRGSVDIEGFCLKGSGDA